MLHPATGGDGDRRDRKFSVSITISVDLAVAFVVVATSARQFYGRGALLFL